MLKLYGYLPTLVVVGMQDCPDVPADGCSKEISEEFSFNIWYNATDLEPCGSYRVEVGVLNRAGESEKNTTGDKMAPIRKCYISPLVFLNPFSSVQGIFGLSATYVNNTN